MPRPLTTEHRTRRGQISVRTDRPSVVLLALAAVLLTLACVSLWADRLVLQPAALSGAARHVFTLQRPAEVLSEAIWTHVRLEIPAAREVDPGLAQRRVAAVIAKGEAATLLSQAAHSFYEALLDPAATDVVVDLSAEQGFLTDAAHSIDPGFAAALPAADEWGTVILVPQGRLPDLRTLVSVTPWLWPAALLGSALLAVLALAGALDRLRAAGLLGLMTTLSGVFLLLASAAALLGGRALAPPGTEGLLLAESLPAFLPGLAALGGLLVAAGLLLALSAGSLRRRRPSPHPHLPRRPAHEN
jgi:hypothetical protein